MYFGDNDLSLPQFRPGNNDSKNCSENFGPVFGYLFRFTGLQDRTVLKVILTRCHYMILKFPVKAKLLLKYFELHNHLL